MASAVDNKSATAGSTTGGAKPNPVAREVQVVATGTRPGANAQKRELFTETTNTVLVFENGGVIRLSADVAPGQLFFVTNQESQKEVVAQVIRSRSFGPASFYVELEFTEPAPEFWGPLTQVGGAEAQTGAVPNYELAEKPKISPPSPPAADIAKLVEAAGDELGAPHPAPSAQELERLKQEVETLRSQVKTLAGEKPGARLTQVIPTDEKLFNTRTETGAARALPKLQLPIETPVANESESFNEEDLLPKPSLDFSQMPAELHNSAGPGLGARGLRIVLMVAGVLAVGTGVAWFMNMLPGVAGPKSLFGNKKAVSALHGATAAPAAKKTENLPTAKTETPTGAATNGQKGLDKSAAITTTPTGRVEETPGVAAEDTQKNLEAAAKEELQTREAKLAETKTSKKAEAVKFSDVAPIAPAHGATSPPKVLETVRPVAPPEAIRGYVTGNVDLDVLVDENGQVKSAKAVAGADVLREAAVTTVKKYKYQAALQDGKPVVGHLKVTVQFWYEP